MLTCQKHKFFFSLIIIISLYSIRSDTGTQYNKYSVYASSFFGHSAFRCRDVLILNGVFVGSITTAVAFDELANYHLIALSFCLTMSVTSQPYRRNYSLSLFISLSGLPCSDCSITSGRVFSSNWTNLQLQNREPYAHYYTWWNASFASRAEAMA